MDGIRYYIPGIILILTAILIVAVPEILIAFVAATITLAGIGALYLGHMIRKAEGEFREFNGWSSYRDFFGQEFSKRPVLRRWHRWF